MYLSDKCLHIFKIYLVEPYQTLQLATKDDTTSYQLLQFESVETTYETLTESKNSKHSPIPVNEFPEYYLKQANDMFADLVKQYNAVPMGSVMDSCVGKMFINKVKNRNLNIIPFDHTRVKLSSTAHEKLSDYINASYIRGPYKEKAYLATQGPKPETVYDFWRMVYFEQSPLIVMLTNLKEEGKVKCTQYWPAQREEIHKDFKITLLVEKVYPDFVRRDLIVKCSKEKHRVTQLHFTSWPDPGFPEYSTKLLNFCKVIRREFPYSIEKPIIVHCNAGVGRSGTFILIDAMLELIQHERKVDIYNYFQILRRDRMQMVQTTEQYIFIHDAIYDFICCGETAISSLKLKSELAILQKDQGNGKSQLKLEFEKQHQILPSFNKNIYINATLPNNAAKNRNPNVMACKLFILNNSLCMYVLEFLVSDLKYRFMVILKKNSETSLETFLKISMKGCWLLNMLDFEPERKTFTKH